MEKGRGYIFRRLILPCILHAALSEAGLIEEKTARVVLVHEVQVFEEFSSLMEEKDKRVTSIVTSEGIYRASTGT
ncbi:MAG: hypothetical protein AB1487_08745 [Thermodesulfobacteriota bacterium]